MKHQIFDACQLTGTSKGVADVILREMLGPVVFGWEHVIVVASDVQSLPEQFRGLLAQKEYTDPGPCASCGPLGLSRTDCALRKRCQIGARQVISSAVVAGPVFS